MLSVFMSLLASGCSSVGKQVDKLPQGEAASIHYVRTGKFSSTTIELENFLKDEESVSADVMRVKHSNAWMPNIEITAKGYKRLRSQEDTP